MIKKIISIVIALGVIAATAAGLWYYRPWSKYSPYKIAEMQRPENLVKNFRSMEEIFPFRVVKRGDEVSKFQEDLAPLKVTYEWKGKTKTLEQFIKESVTTGLMVTKGGTIKYEQYFHSATRETRFTSWSVAKSFVATAIFMALKEGKISSIDDKAEIYAPQFKGSGFGQSSIRDLLMMSTGVKFNENYADPNSDIKPYFFDTFIWGKNADELLRPFKRNRPPQSDFHYISPNSHILTGVLRGIYKKPLADIISDKIWIPLGMESDGFWNQNVEGDGGLSLGYCCLNARLRDFARLGQFYLDGHKGQGKAVDLLPEGWIEKLRRPSSPLHAADQGNYRGRGYSYHFWLPNNPDGEYFASGVYGQFIWIDPNRDLVITRTSADPAWSARTRESIAVMRAITAAYKETSE